MTGPRGHPRTGPDSSREASGDLARRRLKAHQKFPVLAGRPFAPGRTELVPRLPETLALSERIAELVTPRVLAEQFDADEPEYVLLALCATEWPGKSLLTPYRQLVAGLLLALARRTDLLTEASARAVLDRDVRTCFCGALADPAGPTPVLEQAVRLAQREEDFFDVARESRRRRSRLTPREPAPLGTPDDALADARALAADPWFPLDWEIARQRTEGPVHWYRPGPSTFTLRSLLRHADCPPDVALRLAHINPDVDTFLRIFPSRERGLTLLRTLTLTRETAALAQWAATAHGSWQPEVTVADVLRVGRPVSALVHRADTPFPTALRDDVRQAALPAFDSALRDCPQERLPNLDRLLPGCEGTLPELIEAAAGAGAGAGAGDPAGDKKGPCDDTSEDEADSTTTGERTQRT